MKIARMLGLAVLLTPFAAALAAQAQPVKDIAGWSDTRWGMTIDEVKKSHPGMALASQYHHWSTDNRGKSSEQLRAELAAMDQEAADCHTSADAPTYQLGDSTISGGSFRVCAQFKDERLRRVELIGPENTCYPIVETLTAKYGQPAKQELGFHLWLLPTTTIRLIDSTLMGDRHCKVIYHPTEHSDAL